MAVLLLAFAGFVGPAAGSARAAVQETETNDDYASADWMTLGESYFGDLGYRAGNPPDQQDYFQFNLSKDQLFSVTVSVSISVEGMGARLYDPDQQEANSSLYMTGGKQWECNRSAGSQPGVWYLVLTSSKANYTIDTWTMPPYVDPIPKITITSPANNSVAQSLLVDVKGNASDEKAVNAVYVHLDGAPVQNWTKATGTTDWNATVNISEAAGHGGSIKLWAYVIDADGNTNNTTVAVYYSNHIPKINIHAPLSNQTVPNLIVQVTIDAWDDKEVAMVYAYPEGAPRGEWTKASGSMNMYTAYVNISNYSAKGGMIRLFAFVEDSDGNTKGDNVTVFYYNNQPKITIGYPYNNTAQDGPLVEVQGTASDDKPGLKVEVYPEGTLPAFRTRATGTDVWTALVNLSNVPVHGGNIRIFANATDSDGNTNETFITVCYQGYSPMIAITAPGNNSKIKGTVLNISGTASDDKLVEKIDVAPEGVGPAFWTRATGTTQWNARLDLAGHLDQNGSATVWAYVTDDDGNVNSTSIRVICNAAPPDDTTPPTISITSPTEGQILNDNNVTVEGVADDDVGVSSVKVRTGQGSWQDVTLVPGVGTRVHWNLSLTLPDGSYYILATATDSHGNNNETFVSITVQRAKGDQEAPELSVTFPTVYGYECSNSSIIVYGTARDNSGVQKVAWRDDASMTPWQNASTSDGWRNWSIFFELKMGPNYMEVRATDINGLGTSRNIMVHRTDRPMDLTPPFVEIRSPTYGKVVQDRRQNISGVAGDDRGLALIAIKVNGVPADSRPFYGSLKSANWSFEVMLKTGTNTINVTVTDDSGKTACSEIKIIRSGETPQPFPGFEGPLLFAGLAIAAVLLSRKKKS